MVTASILHEPELRERVKITVGLKNSVDENYR